MLTSGRFLFKAPLKLIRSKETNYRKTVLSQERVRVHKGQQSQSFTTPTDGALHSKPFKSFLHCSLTGKQMQSYQGVSW